MVHVSDSSGTTESIMVTTRVGIREAAEDLVQANLVAEPAIIRAYLFPSEREIRLVYIDPTTSPLHTDERVTPFYFGASKYAASPSAAYTTAIALVLPEEEGRVRLPEGWGDWADADVVWEAGAR